MEYKEALRNEPDKNLVEIVMKNKTKNKSIL